EVARLGHAEELREVRGVARPDLERAVDVRDAVRVAVDEGVDRQPALVGELADEAARRARGHSRHRDEDAVRGLPELVALEALEDAAGLDREDELRVGLEGELLDARGDRVGARAEARAVDALDLAGLPVGVEDDEAPGDGAAVLVGDETQLLAREPL